MAASAPARLVELYAPVAADLELARRAFVDELGTDDAPLAELWRHVEHLSGKQLRPALLLLTGQACGGVRHEHHTLAAVVEMVHIATLVHDDVLDDGDVRRRVATVNRLWGNERAVLLGDCLFSHAYHLCSSLSAQYAARLIGRTAVRVCGGEIMQIAGRNNGALTEAEYLDIIERKTAALIATSTLLGAKYAGADERTVTRLHEFGRCLGLAFQIVDDVLDLVGDEAVAGKTLGRDADQGKLTLPAIHFLREAPAAERAALRALLRGAAPQRHGQIAALLADSDSIAYARRVAESYVDQALVILDDLPLSPARSSLVAMAEFTLQRRF